MKKAVVIYWSATGNTQKVAQSIRDGLDDGDMEVSLVRVQDAENIDFYEYDLVCMGAPSYGWHVPKPVDEYFKGKFNLYKK